MTTDFPFVHFHSLAPFVRPFQHAYATIKLKPSISNKTKPKGEAKLYT